MKGCSEDLAMLYFQALSPVSKIKQEDDRISVLWVAESVEETYCDYFYIRGDSVVHFDWSLARGWMSQCSDDIFILYHVIVDRYGEVERTEDLIYVEWKAKCGETIFIDRFVIEEDHIKHDFWIEKYKSKMLWM